MPLQLKAFSWSKSVDNAFIFHHLTEFCQIKSGKQLFAFFIFQFLQEINRLFGRKMRSVFGKPQGYMLSLASVKIDEDIQLLLLCWFFFKDV